LPFYGSSACCAIALEPRLTQAVSPRTIVAYRDSFRLLLQFLKKRTGKQPFTLYVDDLDAHAIIDFLERRP
jgi:hypothetical protein